MTIKISRRDIVVGGALATTAAATFALQPRRLVGAGIRGDIARYIPLRAGVWSVSPDSADITPPEDGYLAAQAYQSMVTRTYGAATDMPVMFVLAYAPRQSGTLIVHRPEICYPGAGFTITSDQLASTVLGPQVVARGRFLSTQRGERVEHVLYWTRLGDSFPQSWEGAHFDVAYQNLRGLVPDGALVRFSVIASGAMDAFRVLNRFAMGLYEESNQNGRALLAGPALAALAA